MQSGTIYGLQEQMRSIAKSSLELFLLRYHDIPFAFIVFINCNMHSSCRNFHHVSTL